jgi:mRNA-degrading endonuclease RelE of RelBE toxin-antitoxin system
MNKIQKFINRLSKDRKSIIAEVVSKVVSGEFETLDVKKLKGRTNLFRVRVGRFRIFYKKHLGGYEIVDITNRDDNTYN